MLTRGEHPGARRAHTDARKSTLVLDETPETCYTLVLDESTLVLAESAKEADESTRVLDEKAH